MLPPAQSQRLPSIQRHFFSTYTIQQHSFFVLEETLIIPPPFPLIKTQETPIIPFSYFGKLFRAVGAAGHCRLTISPSRRRWYRVSGENLPRKLNTPSWAYASKEGPSWCALGLPRWGVSAISAPERILIPKPFPDFRNLHIHDCYETELLPRNSFTSLQRTRKFYWNLNSLRFLYVMKGILIQIDLGFLNPVADLSDLVQ